ncbi:MAG: substrate-binding domain-containing protein [Leptothrix sp. (in: b-proteobacteria)]
MGIDLKQLSARLGLSQTTVSRALNGYTDVSEKTRQRVVQVAAELGYQPNLGARRLATGRTEAVGIVYPMEMDYLGNPSFLEMLGGVSDRLETAGYELLIAAARQHTELRTYERLVRGRRVDGLIVANTRVVDARIDYLRQAGLPFVAYGRTGQPHGYAWLDDDNEASSRLTVQRLVALGHRRIGLIHAPIEYNFAQQRYRSFLQAMAQAGLPVPVAYLSTGSMDRRGGYLAMQQMLALAERPTAIMVDNNIGGVGVMHALLDAGLQPGRDISVVVDGGLPEDTLLNGPSVATIEHPSLREAGQTMADMLLALIDGGSSDGVQVLRPVTLREGTSIGPAPAA